MICSTPAASRIDTSSSMKTEPAPALDPPATGDGEPWGALIAQVRRDRGLDLACYDGSFVRKAIIKRMLALGRPSVAAYGDYLAAQPAEGEVLERALNIGYSEFFRNPLTFALLEQRILPSLVAAKKHAGQGEVRVWSAGCSSGQEAWSIAMLLDALAGVGEPAVHYRIFATDRSAAQLAMARAGIYSGDAVANVRARQLRDYFERQGEAYVIGPRLRERVDFSSHDLLDESLSSPEASLYGDFDLILCCNLLFYYRPDIQRRILHKLASALSPGGYCVTGEAERDSVVEQGGLHPVALRAALFQKTPGCRAAGGVHSHSHQGFCHHERESP